ncbi:MAG: ABC transporter permease [Woeseiaceae bacterium]|nr:ABC transporter permease [Woeseiaceae bacterium]
MIPVTWRASLGYLLRHPWQLALSVVGIGIGVAVIVAVDLANASARKAFLLSMDAVTGEATHQVVGGPRGVDEQLYVDLRTRAGLRNVAPVVEGVVAVDDVELTLLGVDLFAEQELRDFTQDVDVGSGDPAERLFRAFVTESGAAVMSRATAASLGLGPGDRFAVETGGRRFDAELIGVYGDDTAALDNLVTVDIATAQTWLAQPGYLSRIDARIETEDALAMLRAFLPDGVQVLSAAGRTRTTADLSNAFMTNLTAMSLLALLVGLFLIYNSVSFSVLQRRPLIGVLRALGITRRQVLALVLGEAAVLGSIAALLGVLLGTVLGEQLLALVSRSINDLYFRVSVTEVAVSTSSVAKGLIAGVLAATAAAAVPALEATGYEARLAMTRSALERRTRRLLPLVAAGGVATIALAAVVLAVSGRNLVAGLTAVFLLILGFALVVPLLVRAATQVITPLAAKLGRTAARLAVSGVAAGLSRTGVAVVALAVAVSATIGVSVMVDSFRRSVDDWLSQTLQADVYVGVQRGALDAGIVADIAALPAVDAYSTSRRAWLEDDDGRTQLVAIRMAPGSYAGTDILDAEPALVWPRWESQDAVLVSEPYAYQNGVAKGDSLTLRTDRGARSFDILATYQSYDVNANAVLVSRTTYDRWFDDDGIDSIGLYLAPGTAAADVIADVERIATGRQQVTANSNARIRELSLEIFDQTFVITDVLYWLATGVAVIGILSSMLALQLENGREQGVLRALGMTPLQVGGMITAQTGIIGLLSGLAAIPLGLVMAYVLIEVINRRAFGWQIDVVVTPGILLTAVALAVAAALLAGLYPAWRAGRAEPAIAMREE